MSEYVIYTQKKYDEMHTPTPTPTTYNITINTDELLNVEYSGDTIEGSVITLTVVPDELLVKSYTITVKTASEPSTEIDYDDETKTFIMPANDVIVTGDVTKKEASEIVTALLNNTYNYTYDDRQYQGIINFTPNTNTFDIVFSQESASKEDGRAVINDVSRLIGAMYRANSTTEVSADLVDELTYNNTTYTWNIDGTSKGSNYANGEETLTHVLDNYISSTISTGYTEFTINITNTLLSDTIIKFCITINQPEPTPTPTPGIEQYVLTANNGAPVGMFKTSEVTLSECITICKQYLKEHLLVEYVNIDLYIGEIFQSHIDTVYQEGTTTAAPTTTTTAPTDTDTPIS